MALKGSHVTGLKPRDMLLPFKAELASQLGTGPAQLSPWLRSAVPGQSRAFARPAAASDERMPSAKVAACTRLFSWSFSRTLWM